MSCQECGREEGHHLGCERIAKAQVAQLPQVAELGQVDTCAFGDCDNPKIDHPRAKYCEAHKDPKNRKE